MPEAKTPNQTTNNYPSWSPRFWHGMRTPIWWRTIVQNRFRFSFSRLPIAVGVSFFTPMNDVLAFLQWMIFGRKIRGATPNAPPVFIIGHWRSGTTLLHELLVTDPQFASPTTYQCFAPSHHLITQWAFVKFGRFLLPKKRPMDNMSAGWELPQEDEFALMNLGAGSPYLRIAFPRTQPKQLEFLTLDDVEADKKQHWESTLAWFVRTLIVANPGKRLVMKSPTHTGRVALLAKLFPNAKFVHLSRDPRKLVPSTIRLWKSLDAVQSLQVVSAQNSADAGQEYVDECMHRMYDGFERQVASLSDNEIVHLRYEDLARDPKAAVEKIYDELQLGDFQLVLPHLEERLKGHKEYQTNQHSMNSEMEENVMRRWERYAEMFGY